MSRWTSVTCDVPLGVCESVLVPILFDIFINDIDTEIKATVSNLADNTKLSVGEDKPEERDAIQRGHVNLMRFNKAQCKILHLCWGNPYYQYRLEDEGIPQFKKIS
ncbi:rna-directed dna polymerase from mobile element jockey-like [Willisornis vidua]|uniref:Rna-directed dna polymerase from mobile element jockey-like n=1 Tax=Willisornis vidua TaxID=1566151 RepID=A0ABQ9CXY0_9PASS|nr:rna-directed dna polymerase from mobile element jockey-like [Willisornis vidua]